MQSFVYRFAMTSQRRSRSKAPSINQATLFDQLPTTAGGACARPGVGPYAAWMPRKSLHGRTCGVSHAGTRASARSEPKHSHEPADFVGVVGLRAVPHPVSGHAASTSM
ncbi:hypothetical protein E1J24_07570 [Xanthomonas hortorum pv. pelargonii]|uniref:Uncharacterized protein n=1 Tax=Xanthomonas hortorum pv. pelargonii TaxID=453602 RepID=A0AAW9ZPV1_9XANT|nr:hypothetical protein [Xanthomonas hortorum pv. pelargonii]